MMSKKRTPQPQPQQKVPNLFIATPAFGGKVYLSYMTSLFDLLRKFWDLKWPYALNTIEGESLIQFGRNNLASDFLDKTDCTHMIFIDADISFRPDDVISMLQCNRPVIGGMYLKKNIDWNAVKKNVLNPETPKRNIFDGAFDYAMFLDNPEELMALDRTIRKPFPVKYLATGFMMIRRDTLERLRDKVMHYELKGEKRYNFFELRKVSDDLYLSEDLSFCHLCGENGIQIELAPWINLVHTGNMGFGEHLL